MSFLPTLNEFTNENHGNDEYKKIVNDIFEFPEGEERFKLRLQAIQRIDDIVMFHRFVMVTHENNQQIVEPWFKKFNEHYQGMFDSVRHDNPDEIATTRMVFNAFDIYKQQSQIKCIANESIVINLWATIEQYTHRILKVLLTTKTSSSYEWSNLVKKFKENSIDINALSSYSIIDEIRVLNNKIKHSSVVDNTLANFQFFNEYNGKSISEVPIRVKDYTIATYHFIVQLINIIGPSERYPDGEESES